MEVKERRKTSWQTYFTSHLLFLTLFSVSPTVNGSDVYMNSCLYGNGTSFVESLFEDFGEETFKSVKSSHWHKVPFRNHGH